MKIALIGSPTSGKSELAKELQKNLGTQKTCIIDDYVDALSSEVDTAFGHFATWLGNLQIAIERFNRERAAKSAKWENIIVCGTMIETLVYQAMYSTLGMSNTDDQVKAYSYARNYPTVEVMGGMMADTWDYDHAFYLPLKMVEDKYDERVDTNIQQALSTFNVPYVTVDSGNVEEALKKIREKDEAINAESVSGSGEGGPAIGDTPGPVSDVREQGEAE